MTDQQLKDEINEVLLPYGGAVWYVAPTLGEPRYVLSTPGMRGTICESTSLYQCLAIAKVFVEHTPIF